jgi:phage shock protein PspC (stress-responsive transcriptional regulator)
MNGPGFVFWGLFLVFGVMVLAYVLWMLWVERRR